MMGGLAVGMSVPLVASPLQASPATSQAVTLLPGPTGPTRSPEVPREARERAREARLPSFALAGETGAAYDDLNHALLLAHERGHAVPCRGAEFEAWTSDDPEDQVLAADLCYDCPAMLLCKRYADLADEQIGVWGGELREPAARRLTLCGKGLHDITQPGAVRVNSRGWKQCLACRAASSPRSEARRRPREDRKPRPARARERHPAKPTGQACACGCEGHTKLGRYLPGHDARHVGQLVKYVRAGALTQERALRSLAETPKLRDKLAARLAA